MAGHIAISISESGVNVGNNTSVVTVNVYYYGNGVSWNSDKCPGTIVIDGSSYSFSHAFTTSTSAQWLGSASKTVAHNSNGAKTVSCSARFVTGVSLGTLTTSGSKTLTTIPRVSDLALDKTSVMTDGIDAVTATATKKNSGFTDELKVSLGTYSMDIVSGEPFTIPTEWINAIPFESATAKVSVTTYSGSTKIGTAEKDLTVIVPDSIKPTITSVKVAEANSTVSNLFGSGVFVTGLSTLNVEVVAQGAYGSEINKYKSVFEGITYGDRVFTTAALSKAGDIKLQTEVSDSRGRAATDERTVKVYPYAAPNIESVSCISDGESTLVTVKGRVSTVEVDGEARNSKTLKIKRKRPQDAEFTDEVTVPLETWAFTVTHEAPVDSRNETWEFEVTLGDKVQNAVMTGTTGTICISRKAGGKGVTLFEEAEKDGFIVGAGRDAEFTGDIIADKDILISDAELQSLWTSVFG